MAVRYVVLGQATCALIAPHSPPTFHNCFAPHALLIVLDTAPAVTTIVQYARPGPACRRQQPSLAVFRRSQDAASHYPGNQVGTTVGSNLQNEVRTVGSGFAPAPAYY